MFHTSQGDITILNGASSGTLVLASGNGEDVYNDATSLTANITGTSGGNFESLVVGTAQERKSVVEGMDANTVNLSASTVLEGAVAYYTFPATMTTPT